MFLYNNSIQLKRLYINKNVKKICLIIIPIITVGYTFFITLEIAGIHADVWKKISTNVSLDQENKVTTASIRMHVARNGGKLLETLGLVPLSKSDTRKNESNCQVFGMQNYIHFITCVRLSPPLCVHARIKTGEIYRV